MKVNILGTDYEIIMNVDPNDENIENAFGNCYYNRKKIYVIDLSKEENWKSEPKESIERKYKEILRHEIIHAFFHESGLSGNCLQFESAWSQNEEMVDWLAIQFPKIYEVYKQLDII